VAANVQRAAGGQTYGIQDPNEAAAEELLREVSSQLVGTTPLRTFANVYDTATGGTSGSPLYSGLTDIPSSILGGLVPESGLVRSAALAGDPLMRQVIQPRVASEVLPAILQNLQQNLPGVRQAGVPGTPVQGLPAAVDLLGRPAPNPQQGLGAILPMRAAGGAPSPVLDAMAVSGFKPTTAADSLTLGYGREIPLSPSERLQYQQLSGARLNDLLSKAVSTPAFQALEARASAGDTQDANTARALMNLRMQSYETVAHTYANAQMLHTIPVADRQSRSQYTSGLRAPAMGYGPNLMAAQQLGQQQAQSQQLLQSLLQPSTSQQLAAQLT
jgi:hypothetical protein